ncbi:MAG TPA: 30S ribosomal protein S5 [Candidatus Paceibacterota bacterium]|nr:30S ribosomal protein S5 [Candidatus Paceibacterota bacterium]HOK97442.1 30S ribosomal protein S5 [Candidatus Paceibacterota bacterium]
MNLRRNFQKITPDFETQVLDISRVARVTGGGKRLSFRATVLVGRKKNYEIGFGIGKGRDVATAIEKATNEAKKNLFKIPVVNNTIPHETRAKYGAAEVILKPAKEGKGIVAGGVPRAIFKLAGIPNISSKILGRTNNAINNARAVLIALSNLKVPEEKTAKNSKENTSL